MALLPPLTGHQHQQMLPSFVGAGGAAGGGVVFQLHRSGSVRGDNWHTKQQLPRPSLGLRGGALAGIQLMTSWLWRTFHNSQPGMSLD